MSEEKKESLVVASKVKAYIKSTGGLSTSQAVIEKLTDKITEMCDQAVENAKNEKRKTVMDRDFD